MQPHRRLPALYTEVEAFILELLADYTRDSQFSVRAVGVVPTHIHILIEKAPWADLLVFIKDFQQYSSERIFVRFPELSRDMHTDRFWTAGSTMCGTRKNRLRSSAPISAARRSITG